MTEVDRAAQAIVEEALGPTLAAYDLGLLAEESDDDDSRHRKGAFWCIDPLDGTLPFIRGERGYAVPIALVSQAGVAELGVVVTPADGVLLTALRGGGAFRDGTPLRVSREAGRGTLRLYVDQGFDADPLRARFVLDIDRIAHELGLDGVEVIGGAGGVVNACATVLDAPACYFKLPRTPPGGGSLWDFAATAAS